MQIFFYVYVYRHTLKWLCLGRLVTNLRNYLQMYLVFLSNYSLQDGKTLFVHSLALPDRFFSFTLGRKKDYLFIFYITVITSDAKNVHRGNLYRLVIISVAAAHVRLVIFPRRQKLYKEVRSTQFANILKRR